MNLSEMEDFLRKLEKNITGSCQVSVRPASYQMGLDFRFTWSDGIRMKHIIDVYDANIDLDYLINYLTNLANKAYLAEFNKRSDPQ